MRWVGYALLAILICTPTSADAGFSLSIGNVAVTSSGGTFDVIATASGQNETVSAFTLKLNLTNQSGSLPVSFTEANLSGLTYFDVNNSNVVTGLNGAGANAGSNTIGFSALNLGGANQNFVLNTPVSIARFGFTADASSFNPGDFIDVGFVFGNTADTTFSNASSAQISPVTVVGGNGATFVGSTRISAVPEPGSVALLAIGAGYACCRLVGRKRKKRYSASS